MVPKLACLFSQKIKELVRVSSNGFAKPFLGTNQIFQEKHEKFGR
jgi:hypothetical protein